MSVIARGQRFALLELSGHAINPAASISGSAEGKESVSFTICDTAWNWREVWQDFSQPRYGRPLYGRRTRALAALDRLEASTPSTKEEQ